MLVATGAGVALLGLVALGEPRAEVRPGFVWIEYDDVLWGEPDAREKPGGDRVPGFHAVWNGFYHHRRAVIFESVGAFLIRGRWQREVITWYEQDGETTTLGDEFWIRFRRK